MYQRVKNTRWKMSFCDLNFSVPATLSSCCRGTCCLITTQPSSSSSSSLTGTNLSSFVCVFFFLEGRASRPGGPGRRSARLASSAVAAAWSPPGPQRERREEITALMFYSCPADHRDRQTASRFILESDAEAEQEVIDLQGSFSKTSRVSSVCYWRDN